MWSQLMSAAGYTTYMTGKWHVPKVKPEDIFDVVVHPRPGMPKDHWGKGHAATPPSESPFGYNRPLNEADYEAGWKPWDREQGGFWEGGKHWSEVLGDDSIGFIESAAKEDNPFFMYLAFNAPHDPRQSPKKYVDMYPLERIEMPANFRPLHPRKDGMGTGESVRDERLAPFPRTEYAIKVNRQEYFAIVTHMDEQVGRILDALEASGKADNTYIFFTADHGLAVGHHGLVGKQNLYEHSMRPPFIVAGPGVTAGKWEDTRIYLQDIMPTSLDLAGADIPEDVQFKSLLPVLKGGEEHYEAIYGGYKTSLQRAVIKGDWKLILYPAMGAMELYNLKDDPYEMNDLSQWPAYACVIKDLECTLSKLQKETGDELDLSDPASAGPNEGVTPH
jgi:choline-sulfatase